MNQERIKRKLSGILSADAVGYSRLMEEDEMWTIQLLEESKSLIGERVEEYDGRVVDAPGDNLLAEFSSVINALDCAVKIQQDLKSKNSDLPEDKRMEFRIGVNLGDIVEEDDRIYGDGVNIAARIEGLAEPGGICISRTTYDQVKSKLNLGYEYLGEHTVKNITEPVRVYRVLLGSSTIGRVIGEKRFLGRLSKKTAMAVILILFIATAGSFSWILFSPETGTIEPASVSKMAYPLPDKPSIAVLPFKNLSGDPDQEYFSDGLTEEIITGLSKIPELFVIARDSAFTYKDRLVKLQQVSEELGVRYVLEGSVRREGDRVRVTVQLLDAIDGNYIWSERYDRQIKDILALQTEIMMQISIELQIILTDGEQARLSTTEMISNVEFYETQLKLQGYYQQGTIEGRETAKQLARKLIDMNPQNSLGYFWLGYLHLYDNFYGTTRNPQESIRIAEEKAEQALTLDKDTKDLNLLLGYIHLQKGEHEAAVSRMEKAVEEQPNGYEPHQHLGIMLFFVGRYSEAIQHLEMAHRLDPYPDADLTAWLGIVHTTPGPDALHNVKKAKELGEKGLKVNPNNFFPHLLLTLLYSYENNMDRAGFHADEMLRISPAYSLDVFRRIWVFRDQKIFNFHIDLLRKAGIPEK